MAHFYKRDLLATCTQDAARGVFRRLVPELAEDCPLPAIVINDRTTLIPVILSLPIYR